MTASKDPERRRSGRERPASRTASRTRKTPLARRLEYLFQDLGYAMKKAGRRVADPIRDARAGGRMRRGDRVGKEASGSTRSTRAGARGERPTPGPGATGAKAKRGLRARVRAPARGRGRVRRPSESGARHLGDRSRAKGSGRSERRHAGLSLPSASSLAAAITRFGERASKLILGALAPLAGPLRSARSLGLRALERASALLTPLRATLVVCAVAAICLAASQFLDYRGIAVGAPDYSAYSDVEVVAPAPQVDRRSAGSAHAFVMIPLALASLAALFACARGRWQLGRVVALVGLLAVAITLLVDMPAGLDEGEQALAYAGVEAQLAEGFYAQLGAAAVLVATGLLASRYARPSAARRTPRSRRRKPAAAPGARSARTA